MISEAAQNNGRSHTLSAYAAQYIHRSLTCDVLPPPELTKVGSYSEVIQSVYTAHCQGGSPAARTAWDTIVRFRPELKTFPRPQNIIDADDLKNLAKPEFLLPGYPFYAAAMNAVIGAPGSGKSFVALDVCAKMVKAGKRILYIAGEGLHGYADRWEVVKDFLQIERESRNMKFYQQPIQFVDPLSYQMFIEELQTIGFKPDMVVIDTLARSAVGLDENSAMEMGRFIHAVDTMRREMGCGVLIVHHSGKNGIARGSNALHGACDSVLVVTKDERTIKLSNDSNSGGKNKYSAEADPVMLEMVDRHVDDFESIVLMPGGSVVRSPKMTGKLTTSQRAILEFLDMAAKGVKAQEIIDSTNVSRSQIYRVLKELLESHFVTLDETADLYRITEDGRQAWRGL